MLYPMNWDIIIIFILLHDKIFIVYGAINFMCNILELYWSMFWLFVWY